MAVTRTPLTHSDRAHNRPLYERAGAVIGIGTGVFGTLTVLGMALLPTSTWTQRALILATCLALASASLTGIGAWQSASRFVLTAAAVAVALLCLAGLSVVTDSESHGNAGRAPQATRANLGELKIVKPGEHGWREVTVNREQYRALIPNPRICTQGVRDVEYQLDGRYAQFHAEVGIDDLSPSGSLVTFEVLVDGQMRASETVGLTDSKTIEVPLTGASRMTLAYEHVECEVLGGFIDPYVAKT